MKLSEFQNETGDDTVFTDNLSVIYTRAQILDKIKDVVTRCKIKNLPDGETKNQIFQLLEGFKSKNNEQRIKEEVSQFMTEHNIK